MPAHPGCASRLRIQAAHPWWATACMQAAHGQDTGGRPEVGLVVAHVDVLDRVSVVLAYHAQQLVGLHLAGMPRAVMVTLVTRLRPVLATRLSPCLTQVLVPYNT